VTRLEREREREKAKVVQQRIPKDYTIKHYGLVMYGFHSKLVCLSKPVKVTVNYKTR
jgi:hypothetical protein